MVLCGASTWVMILVCPFHSAYSVNELEFYTCWMWLVMSWSSACFCSSQKPKEFLWVAKQLWQLLPGELSQGCHPPVPCPLPPACPKGTWHCWPGWLIAGWVSVGSVRWTPGVQMLVTGMSYVFDTKVWMKTTRNPVYVTAEEAGVSGLLVCFLGVY